MGQKTPTVVRDVQDLSDEEVGRIFAHGLHEEGIFYNRLNFFLVFESLLVAALISGLTSDKTLPKAVVLMMCVGGFIFSVLWWYVQYDKLILLWTLEDRIRKTCEECDESIRIANNNRRINKLSSSGILAHALPALFVLWWLSMFVKAALVHLPTR